MKNVITSGRLKEIAGVTPHQIRTWEDQGLVRPARDGRNHRVFSREDVRKILEISGLSVTKRISRSCSSTAARLETTSPGSGTCQAARAVSPSMR